MKKLGILIVSGLLIACMAGSAMAIAGINLVSHEPTTGDGSAIQVVPGSKIYLDVHFSDCPVGNTYFFDEVSAKIKKPGELVIKDATDDEVLV